MVEDVNKIIILNKSQQKTHCCDLKYIFYVGKLFPYVTAL